MLAFSEARANVALLSRTKAELHKSASECEKFGVKTIVVLADVTNEEQVDKEVKMVSTDPDKS